ncbi:uncharacterized protein LOC132725920 isoform X3 [Ruditapes philippinarum]|uniref:uncharacterized protein LOC132725920 isoform X3 n=1 Tax=Ruditapes philippinarum TaxID=129788 RepID=UPI00295B0223|nr:uncharacterized protein LOC132725920 isoform X3 [Ruditapes philippinarum]
MKKDLSASLLVVTYFILGVGAFVSTQETIRCLRCDHASSDDECGTITCDKLEECYTDEVITDQLTIVYNAGCRAKQVCHSTGKRSHFIDDCLGCSRCCSWRNDCNRLLCALTSASNRPHNRTQCYSCDHRSSEQSDISDPRSCTTFDWCQPNEVRQLALVMTLQILLELMSEIRRSVKCCTMAM